MVKTLITHVDDHGNKYDALTFWCPGCSESYGGLHMLPVNTTNKSPAWDWDGNLESPTLSPSILTKTKHGDGKEFICHSFLKNGVFEFLSDCTHSLKDQKVPIPDLPKWVVDDLT